MPHTATLYVAIDETGALQADEDRDIVIERMMEANTGPFRMHALNITTTLPGDIQSDLQLSPDLGELVAIE